MESFLVEIEEEMEQFEAFYEDDTAIIDENVYGYDELYNDDYWSTEIEDDFVIVDMIESIDSNS